LSRSSGRAGRARRAGSSRFTLGAALVALVALVGAIASGSAGACAPDIWLNDLGSSTQPPRPSGGSSDSSGRPSSKKDGGTKPTTKDPSGGGPAPTDHLELGTPTDKDSSDDHLLLKPQYALSYSNVKNVPNWVSWHLNASFFGDVPRYKGKFLSDSSLPDGFYRVRHDDYVGSGYDRGHMVRSEERTRTPDDNKATFLMTNILPQYHDLNAGPWLRLEEHCQELAQKSDRELFILSGGVFSKRPETIGKDVAVPESCFKIAVVLEKGQGAADITESTRVIAVIMPNTKGILDKDWKQYRTTVDEIERRTGYDFLTRVPEALQAILESRTDSP
jgi:endonuclease G, mitochondrial